MKKHIMLASILSCVLLTGCSTPAPTPTPTNEEEEAILFTSESPDNYGEPVWIGNINNHGNLTFGGSTGGNFRLIRSFGDYGYEEYDVQYDDTTGYKSTYVYVFPTYGQSIEEYKDATNLPIDLKYLENVQNNLYVANLEDNGLPGFDTSMSQDDAYNAVMSAVGIDVIEVPTAEEYSPSMPPTDYITMQDSFLSMGVGDSTMLTITHLPNGYNSLVFDIDDPLIADLTSDGTVTGVKAGTTYIHVSTPDYTYTTTVIVEVK